MRSTPDDVIQGEYLEALQKAIVELGCTLTVVEYSAPTTGLDSKAESG